ncbi:MAG: protein kinase [Pirellulales bacterium]
MSSPCSIALLESALAGNLPAADETSLNRHLEACEACSAALERMAGGPAWCREAVSLLAGDELDLTMPTGDEWSEVDFTVEHLEPTDEPNVLGRLGGYDILEIIGHGGMGVVLKAFDRELNRTVAIKVLAPHLARNSLARKRFAREAQAAAAVVHPHVLAIHQVQAGGRLPFLVMPLVAGESLAERLTAQGTLELKEILRIGMQAAAGLAAAHEQGLVHRDVKPANILLEKGVERAVLTDFGLARAADDVTLTRWGIVAGTPQYMSPEQARGEPLDGRSDLFSLGCVLYEMATGVSPFRTDSMLATMRRLVDDSPQAMASLNPELPPWFIAIVERLLEKDPSRRLNSTAEVSALLENCLAHVQRPAAVPLPEQLRNYQSSTAKRGRWSTWKLLAGAAFALALLVAGVVIVLETNKGTLTIESDANVELRITQGDKIVEELTVTRGKNDVRIAAGEYVVEIDGKHNAITVKNGSVTIHRGEKEIVRIVERDAADTAATERMKMTADTTQVLTFDEPIPRALVKNPDVLELTALAPNKVQVFAKKPGATQINLWKQDNTVHTIDVLVSGDARELEMLLRTEFPNASIRVRPLAQGVVLSGFVDHQDDVSQIIRMAEKYYPRVISHITVRGAQREAADGGHAARKSALDTGFSETKELVLSMNSMHYMLDFDTGKTLDPPATVDRPEIQQMDVYATQLQPHQFPTGLSGAQSFLLPGQPMRGMKVKSSQWNASAADVRRALAGDDVPPLTEMQYKPLEPATYFFKTEEGAEGILDLMALVEDPKGIRIRYKTVLADGAKAKAPLPEKLYATKEHVRKIEELIKGAPATTNHLAELFERVPGSNGNYRLRADVVSIPIVPTDKSDLELGSQGRVFYMPASKGFFLQWDSIAASTLHYYGPFYGISLARIGSRPRESADKVESSTADESSRAATKRIEDYSIIRPVETIACSVDGKLIAMANGNSNARNMHGLTPMLAILHDDGETPTRLNYLNITSAEENGILFASPRMSYMEVTALAFSPDGSMLAVGTDIGQVKLYDTRTGELVRSLDDEKAKLADKETSENWKTLKRAMGRVESLAYSPDGSLLAVCGGSFSDFSDVFDRIERGGLGRTVTGPGRLKVWEAKTGTLKHDLVGHSQAFDVAFSADGTLLASAGRCEDAGGPGNGVLVWNPQTGEKMRTLLIEANGGTHYVAFSPIKKLIVTGSVHFDKENDTRSTAIGVAYPLSGITEWRQTMPGWAKPAFSADGRTLAVLCDRKSIRFVDVESGQLKHELHAADSPLGGRWNDLAITPQGRRLVIGGATAASRGIMQIREFDSHDGEHGAQDNRSADEETKIFQGEWNVVGLEGDGHKASEGELKTQKWSVEGNTITASAHGSTGKMRFTLNPKKTPKEIDLVALDGNLKGTTTFGIYEFQNGRLRICHGGPMEKETDRPKEFTDSSGSGCGLMIFERKSQ